MLRRTLALLAVAACRVPATAAPGGGGPGGLPDVAPARRAAAELPPDLLVRRPRTSVVIDNSPVTTSAFPIGRGVDLAAAGAPVGTRYLVLAVGEQDGRTLRLGEVELTEQTCPPGEDGAPLPCVRCPDDGDVRFATWVGAPHPLVGDRDFWSWPTVVVVGPLTADDRARIERSLVSVPGVLKGLGGSWFGEMALDVGGDGQIDVLDVDNNCPEYPPPDDPRCNYRERWRRHAGRWWATEWSSRRSLREPARAGALEVFEVITTPSPEPGAAGRYDVGLEGISAYRHARVGSQYLLVDGRAAVALVTTTGAPDRPTATFTAASAPRRSMYAVGPVEGAWAELSRARVRTDFADDVRVLGLPYRLADRDRVVVAVDLDADGRDEVAVLASGARRLAADEEQRRLVRFDLWIDDGERRYLRETMLFWPGVARAIVRDHCRVDGSE